MIDTLKEWFMSSNIPEIWSFYLAVAILVFNIGFIAVIVNWVTKKIVLRILAIFVKKSRTKWDDVLLEKRFFHRLSHIIPAMVIYAFAGVFGETYKIFVQRMVMAYYAVLGYLIISAFLDSVDAIYRSYKVSKEKPIKSYLQVVKIFVGIMALIIAIATVLNQSPWGLLSGIGAMTAILLLIFKDSILGLVAGVQLSANNMVHIGDWIEVPQFNADGDVIEITLNTVKVKNWDRTITTIPTYELVAGSFKNWKGMEESRGRRIKRSVFIDMNTVKFCTGEMLEKFKKVQYISDYIEEKQKELEEYNSSIKADLSVMVNGRHLTNLGTFRAYITSYIRNHPMIKQDDIILIRQLQPCENGLPIEIYAFSSDYSWVGYEGIQSDIFDHILAIVPEFELRVFQNPSGRDFRKITA